MGRKRGTFLDSQTSFALLNVTFEPSSGKKNPNTEMICGDMKVRMVIPQREDVCVCVHGFVVFICTRTYTKCKPGRTRDQVVVVVVVMRRWRYFRHCGSCEVKLIRKKKRNKKKTNQKTFSSFSLFCLHSGRVSHLLCSFTGQNCEASGNKQEL